MLGQEHTWLDNHHVEKHSCGAASQLRTGSMSSNPEKCSKTDESISEAAFWGTDTVKVWKSLVWVYTTSLKLLADEDALLHPWLEATEIQLCTLRLDPSPRLKEESEGLVPLHLHCTYLGKKTYSSHPYKESQEGGGSKGHQQLTERASERWILQQGGI